MLKLNVLWYKRSGDIVSKLLISQGRPLKLHFSLLHTQTRVEQSVLCSSQPMLREDSHSKSHNFLLPFSEKLQVPSCPLSHSGAPPALHSSVFSAAADSPPFLGRVACTPPGRSFTFLRPCTSLSCYWLLLRNRFSQREQIQPNNEVKSGGNWVWWVIVAMVIRSEGIVRVELFLGSFLASPFMFTSSISDSCEFGENFILLPKYGSWRLFLDYSRPSSWPPACQRSLH